MGGQNESKCQLVQTSKSHVHIAELHNIIGCLNYMYRSSKLHIACLNYIDLSELQIYIIITYPPRTCKPPLLHLRGGYQIFTAEIPWSSKILYYIHQTLLPHAFTGGLGTRPNCRTCKTTVNFSASVYYAL